MENVLLLRFGFFCKEIQLQLFLEYGNCWHAALSRRDIFCKCNFEKVSFLYFFLLKSKSPPRNFLFATSEAEYLNCLKLWVTVAFLVQGGLWDSCPPVGLQSLGHTVVPLPWKIKKKGLVFTSGNSLLDLSWRLTLPCFHCRELQPRKAARQQRQGEQPAPQAWISRHRHDGSPHLSRGWCLGFRGHTSTSKDIVGVPTLKTDWEFEEGRRKFVPELKLESVTQRLGTGREIKRTQEERWDECSGLSEWKGTLKTEGGLRRWSLRKEETAFSGGEGRLQTGCTGCFCSAASAARTGAKSWLFWGQQSIWQ